MKDKFLITYYNQDKKLLCCMILERGKVHKEVDQDLCMVMLDEENNFVNLDNNVIVDLYKSKDDDSSAVRSMVIFENLVIDLRGLYTNEFENAGEYIENLSEGGKVKILYNFVKKLMEGDMSAIN